MVKRYALEAGVHVDGLCLHALRATAATNALEHQADLAYVQEWLGHANVATTRLYDDDVHALRIHPPSRSATEQAPPQAAPGIP
jgi:site-specific recombinase XerD